MKSNSLSRRHIMRATGCLMAVESLGPLFAQSPTPDATTRPAALTGNLIDLAIGQTPISIGGRSGKAVTVNGTLPAPYLISGLRGQPELNGCSPFLKRR